MGLFQMPWWLVVAGAILDLLPVVGMEAVGSKPAMVVRLRGARINILEVAHNYGFLY